MALNFAQFINQNTPNLTAQEKQALLDDYCHQQGYTDLIDGLPNPQSKADFFNENLTQLIKDVVKAYRRQVQIDLINVEELDI